MENDKFEKNVVQVSKQKAEDIIDIVESFSHYLSCSNDQFHYNESYLSSKVAEYHDFTIKFRKKAKKLKKLDFLSLAFVPNLTRIIFDRYWCYNENEFVLSVVGEPSFDCILNNSSEFEVKCIFTFDGKGVIHCFHSKVGDIESFVTSISSKMKV